MSQNPTNSFGVSSHPNSASSHQNLLTASSITAGNINSNSFQIIIPPKTDVSAEYRLNISYFPELTFSKAFLIFLNNVTGIETGILSGSGGIGDLRLVRITKFQE